MIAALVFAVSAAPLTARDILEPKKPAAGAFPILYGDRNIVQVAGGRANGSWMDPEEMADFMKAGDLFTFYSLAGMGDPAKLISVDASAPPDVFAKFGGDAFIAPLSIGVAVTPWNALPRAPELLNNDRNDLRDEVAGFLKENNQADAPVRITEVVSIDLEGDGIEEIIVTATNLKLTPDGVPVVNPGAAPGGQHPAALSENEYSLMFLRKVVDGKPKTIPLQESFYKVPHEGRVAENFRLAAVLDLDGDGVQEIVTRVDNFEAGWINVFQVKGAKVGQVDFRTPEFPGDKLGGLALDMEAAEVVELLGEPESKGKEEEWGATGNWVEEWNYPAKGLVLSMASSGQGAPKAILRIVADMKCEMATGKGIKIGSTVGEVKKAYGKFRNKEYSEANVTYVVGSIYGGMILDLKDGKVTRIFIGAQAE